MRFLTWLTGAVFACGGLYICLALAHALGVSAAYTAMVLIGASAIVVIVVLARNEQHRLWTPIAPALRAEKDVDQDTAHTARRTAS